MTAARSPAPSRRAVLAGAGALAVAACTGSTVAPPPRPTADQRLAARVSDDVRALVALYAAVAARHPTMRDVLAPYAAEHAAHLRALAPLRATPAPSASASGAASPTPPPAPPVPSRPASARAAVVAAERAASRRRRRQCRAAGPELARLLASVAACEAVHAALLGSG